MVTPQVLAQWAHDARARTLALVEDLDDAQLQGSKLRIVNPLLWELGHVGWFQEHWMLRHALGRPVSAFRDDLYDSSKVAHGTRWDLPLPSRARTLQLLQTGLEEVLTVLTAAETSGPELAYFAHLTTFHEDMHGEAFWMTRQTLGYAAPGWSHPARMRADPGAEGDALVPEQVLSLGADRDGAFHFDNEKWAHPARVEAFSIKRHAESQAEFLRFVEDGGYERSELWSEPGWRWREEARALHPVHWRLQDGQWQRRQFEAWVPLEPRLPVHHVNYFEAEAYCRWAGRRLPTEAEWMAAAPQAHAPDHAQVDGTGSGPVDVAAHGAGDSPFGCRQMLGNVWEWTASDFLPFPGFSADPYADYSQPWFGTHKVLKGGSWATRARLLRPAFRNFYTPERRDVFAGFRTCALP